MKAWISYLLTAVAVTGCGGGSTSAVKPNPDPVISYSGSTQTTTYSDGSTATVTASTSTETWGSDHVSKTTTYTFLDGGTHSVIETVDPIVTAPTLTEATYPTDWVTNGGVIAPQVSDVVLTYGDGYEVTLQNGDTLPFDQDTLDAAEIFDPNAKVSSATITYDLHWGTPDPVGDAWAQAFGYGAATSAAWENPFWLFGSEISGVCGGSVCGATIEAPHPDVLNAWESGWTGKGVDVIVADFLNGDIVDDYDHGIKVSMIVLMTAPISNIRGIDLTFLEDYDGIVREYDFSISTPLGTIDVEVLNASFSSAGANLLHWVDILSGTPNTFPGFDLSDAVVVHASGNNSMAANLEEDVYAYTSNAEIVTRYLAVGALDKDGSIVSPAELAYYSDYAGDDAVVQSRFLLADGTLPFEDGWFSIDGVAQSGAGEGTSYAAPRVTGYAAVLRHKFPNISGAQSASILLDTARYDTLACYYADGCDSAIYGQGEASLSYALSPVGLLR